MSHIHQEELFLEHFIATTPVKEMIRQKEKNIGTAVR